MSPEIKEILTNYEVIAVNQDTLGREGRRIAKNGDLEVWAKPLSGGNRAVILFNRGTAESEISVSWDQIGYPNHIPAKVRDLWAHKDLGSFYWQLFRQGSVPLRSHGENYPLTFIRICHSKRSLRSEKSLFDSKLPQSDRGETGERRINGTTGVISRQPFRLPGG